jgi:hypothetical protein
VKWLGPGAVKALALAEADRKQVEKDLDSFVKTSIFQILICSYECLRTHVGRLTKHKDCCDLLVCDEAHRLKNSDNQTSKALNSLPVKRRVLLTGTPMQNDLQEFFAMVDFTNPGILVRVWLVPKSMRSSSPPDTSICIESSCHCSGLYNSHTALKLISFLTYIAYSLAFCE